MLLSKKEEQFLNIIIDYRNVLQIEKVEIQKC